MTSKITDLHVTCMSGGEGRGARGPPVTTPLEPGTGLVWKCLGFVHLGNNVTLGNQSAGSGEKLGGHQ